MTMAQKTPSSASLSARLLSLSANSNMESIRKRAFDELCKASRRSNWPLRQSIVLLCESNMVAKRTRRTSKTPGLSRVTLSSSASKEKPGRRLANSTTSRMAGKKRSLKSCNNCCWPLDGAGVGFRGHAWRKKKNIKNTGSIGACGGVEKSRKIDDVRSNVRHHHHDGPVAQVFVSSGATLSDVGHVEFSYFIAARNVRRKHTEHRIASSSALTLRKGRFRFLPFCVCMRVKKKLLNATHYLKQRSSNGFVVFLISLAQEPKPKPKVDPETLPRSKLQRSLGR